ncbi:MULTISPECIES: hypothetical protein [unclassified Ruegeria]|uniref:hypothetical protein n=1 Tax=unclassified Ruegeria TaxID=2625375 RepID=UPI001AE39900|nr:MULTISPECIES: hypothetical protein [unclassified Ruegeria]
MRETRVISRLLWSASVALIFPSVALSTDDDPSQFHEPVLGVEDWLDGCARLSEETVMTVSKTELETDCVLLALEYCTREQSNSYGEICHDILVEHILFRSEEISKSLPVNPNLTEVRRFSYANALQRASEVTQAICGADLSEKQCQLKNATLRWLDLRHADRLLEGERK